MSKKWKVKEVNVEEIDFLEKNAHYMNRGEFEQLSNNIKKDGELTSVPVCILKEDGRYLVISGNHRVKAAKYADILTIYIMYCKQSEISNDEKLGIQISHNTIHGADDLNILRELMEEINSVDFKEYAFVNEEEFEKLNQVKLDLLNPKNEVIMYNFAFFNEDAQKFEDLKASIDKLSSTELERLNIIPEKKLERFNEIINKIQQIYKVKSTGIAISQMVELASKQIEEIKED